MNITKKFLILILTCFIINTMYGAYQYDMVYIKNSSSSINITLNIANNSIKEYGVFSLSDYITGNNNWELNKNFWKLTEGENNIMTSSNLAVWVKTKGNQYYTSVKYIDYLNPFAPGFIHVDDNQLDIFNNKFGHDKYAGQLFINNNKPTGQPLPGIAVSLIVGLGTCICGKKLVKANKC